MENKFKVVMKKDGEVLQDFISFTYRAKGQTGRFKMRVLAAGLVVIGYLAARGGSVTAGIVIGTLGVAFLVMTLFLPQIAVARLKKADIAYQKQTELTYIFTNSNVYVYENGELAQSVGGYNQVSCFFGDEKNYYLGINNDDLYLLPRKAFTEGSEDEFKDFIQRRCDEQYEFLPATVKNKWIRYKERVKQSDAEHDKKAAELRARDKEKRERKKAKKNGKAKNEDI